MSGRFASGEIKVRPGVYFRQENGSGIELTDNGICAVAFRANWGPTNEVVTLESPAEVADAFGDENSEGSNASIIRKIFAGGASIVRAVRVGSDGTPASVTLKGKFMESEEDTVKLTALYPGDRKLTVSVRISLENEAMKELTIYDGTRSLETVSWPQSINDAVGLEYALRDSKYVKAEVMNNQCSVSEVQQKEFTGGANPDIVASDYDKAFEALEATSWNTLCVDTNDTAVHTLVAAFIKRANDSGLLGIAVIGEPHTVDYETRKTRAAAYNSESVVYVLNGFKIGDEAYEGFNAAAVVAGYIAYLPSNDSVTHKVIPGATAIIEPLSNSKVIECLKNGCIVFTSSSSGAVWIEQGINTLTRLSEDQDAGWKKIRRTKARFELITRINGGSEGVIGNINNDSNGRQTVIAIANGVIKDMIAEGKLQSGTCTEDPANPAYGDSAWFVLEILDLDSIEHVYLTYRFRFSDN